MNIGLAARVGDKMRGSLRSCAPPESVKVDVKKGSSFHPTPTSPNRVHFANQNFSDEDEVEDLPRHYALSCCLIQSPLSLTIKASKVTHGDVAFYPDEVQTSWDMWSLGLIMVQLFIGPHPSLPNFEKSEDAHLRNLYNYNLSTLRTICDQISDINQDAADLVWLLLQPDPRRRPDVNEIQRHRYFSINQSQCF